MSEKEETLCESCGKKHGKPDCPNPPETINLPDGEIVPIVKPSEGSGYSRIHAWEHKLRKVLEDILDAVEKEEKLGYFDSLMDIDSHATLIIMARDRYVDIGQEDKHHISVESIKETFRGGYSKEFEERLLKLLAD